MTDWTKIPNHRLSPAARQVRAAEAGRRAPVTMPMHAMTRALAYLDPRITNRIDLTPRQRRRYEHKRRRQLQQQTGMTTETT